MVCWHNKGHNTSSQIIRSVNNATTKAKKILTEYNKACKQLDPNFVEILFNDIKSLENNIFWDYATGDIIDFDILREFMRKQRAYEEIKLLKVNK